MVPGTVSQEAAKALNVTLDTPASNIRTDKPYLESFFGHYKTEEVYRTNYTTLADGQVGWQLYRIWYETERIHESLDYQTPHQRLTNGATMTEGSFITKHAIGYSKGERECSDESLSY